MHARNRFAFLAALALTGCGGGHAQTGSAALPQMASSPAPSAPTSVAVRFDVVLPTASTNALRRAPAYVSGSTQSAAVTVTPDGGSASAPTVINCTAAACSGTVNAPVGSDTFAVALYDGTNGSGHTLSTGSATQTIAADTANAVNVTFNGIVASLAVSLGASGTAGTAASIPLTVNALDAAGNTIVGPGTYVNAVGTPVSIALADSDASGATTPSQTSFTAPVSGATLSYSGLAIAPATLTASASGYTSAAATFTPALQPIVITTSDSLNPRFAGVDFTATNGTGTFSASEVGWTNSPYNQSFTVTPGSGCTTIGTVTPSGNSFTANVAGSPRAGTCTALTLSDGVGQSQAITLAYTTFNYNGGVQSIAVPAGVASATFSAVGAGGGSAGNAGGVSIGAGGSGASENATLTVSAGEALSVIVGGGGGGGGYGGGGGGGGGSFVFFGPALLVAAGGGGGSDLGSTFPGGNGGAAAGAGDGPNPGSAGTGGGGGGGGTFAMHNGGGGGGTTSAGGTGSGSSSGAGGAQTTAAGGTGGVAGGSGGAGGWGGGGGGGGWGGGGGGGYSGGGGGGDNWGGGGGSFAAAGATNVSTATGAAGGSGSSGIPPLAVLGSPGTNGSVTIVW